MASGGDVRPCTNEDCGYPTRSNKQPAEIVPYHTKRRCPHGLCTKCYARWRTKKARELEAATIGEPDPHTVAALQSYLNRRRARQTRYQRTASEHNAV